MDSGILTLVISGAALVGGAIGWLFRQYQYHRTAKRQAAIDASAILKERKSLLEEMVSKKNDVSSKQTLITQLEEVNSALLGLHSARLRHTLQAAGLPPEDILLAEGRSQLQPQQINRIKHEISEVKSLPLSDSIQELFTLANAYHHAKQYDDAIKTYNRIIQFNPNDPKIFSNRGNTYYDLGRYKEALSDYNRSLELSPNDPTNLTNRGAIHEVMGRYDEAFADFNKALEYAPATWHTLWYTLLHRGYTYTQLERYDKAIDDFTNSLEILPDYLDTLNDRGVTYARLRKYDEGLADLNHCLELKPDDPDTLYSLACLFSLWGKPDEALANLEKAIKGDVKYRKMAKTDNDFDNIREDPRFMKLIESD